MNTEVNKASKPYWLMIIGFLQGLSFWGISKLFVLKIWPATDPLIIRALFYLAFALPLATYLTQNIPSLTQLRRRWILIGFSILFSLLGAYSAWAENFNLEQTLSAGEIFPHMRAQDMLGTGVLGFVLLALLIHFDSHRKGWHYPDLFEITWRNALLVITGAILTGVFWVILFAGSMLMESIGIKLISDLIAKPGFNLPVTGFVFGAAFALGLARAEMIVTFRRFWLSISAWFLPLLLFFSVMWATSLPFTGWASLLETHRASYILMWFLALSIKFANAAYQDGAVSRPYAEWLSKIVSIAWLSLLAVAFTAWWAMIIRINQYGWTEDRVWGVFVLLLASLYVVGYACSVRYGLNKMSLVGKTNITVAIVMSLGLVLLLTPLLDARRISVASQMQSIMRGTIDSNYIDYDYFRWNAGVYGQKALDELAKGIAHKDKTTIAARAKEILAKKDRGYGWNHQERQLSVDDIRKHLRIIPGSKPIDSNLLARFQTDGLTMECVQADAGCIVWMKDLNQDNIDEAIIIKEKPYISFEGIIFYQREKDGSYRSSGTIDFPKGLHNEQKDQMLKAIEADDVKAIPHQWSDLEIEGQRIKVSEYR